MRGNTFNALKVGQIATIWHVGSPYLGKCDRIFQKIGTGHKGKGWVVLIVGNKMTDAIPFDRVALGDNSLEPGDNR